MKRRAFCASAVATLGVAALPFDRGFAAVASVTADVQAITGDGKPVTLSRSDVEDLRASLRGQLLLPDTAGYEDARKIFNGMFDKRPALIARCAGAADVVQAVNFARAHSSAGRGARRRSQPVGPVRLRQRTHDRSGGHAQRACGLQSETRPRRRRRTARRRRPGDDSLWPGHDDRHGLAHRRWRLDARRRLRAPGQAFRPDLRPGCSLRMS